MRLCALTLIVLSSASVAAAQSSSDHRVEVSGAWTLLHYERSIGTLPLGWRSTVGWAATPWLAVVADIGANYKTVQIPPIELHERDHVFLGGPTIMFDPASHIRLFAQLRMGLARTGTIIESPSGQDLHTFSNHFTWQPGGGVDVMMADRWAIRVQGDYRVVIAATATLRGESFSTGLVYRF